ncbi:MAG: class I SAM-dependent methyltransferase, partial [Spirochaetia bacterium]|nr:class I SAM-dependent methyltransferase [Spirochaetia bacterium]
HHVWHRKEEVFLRIADLLKPGGRAVIWEPRWPDSMKELKDPSKSGMAFQNLSEHAQGNYFLTPAKIEKEFQNVHLTAQTLLFVNGNEAVTIGTKS